ncbi:HipA domain-containing protein [Cellulomonas sp. ICMP 17802]|uniref:HipA domain-containing protein n=1 Tax=Cellulomonas sp. ICMP 17802 TaxID=3239199 RepID=UPI00351B7C76
MSGDLDVWLYGTPVARLGAIDPARPRLTFTPEALSRWGLNSAVVSGLLPLARTAPAPARVRVWLDGLLPEGRARSRQADLAGVDPDDPVAFLRAYGRDTTGALVLVEAGTSPASDDAPARDLTDDEIGALLGEAARDGAADQITSITGLEAKIALTRTATGWARPAGGRPSTHIVKLGRPAGSTAHDLIDTEHAALALARRTGLGTVESELRTFGGRRAIVVRRYDRLPGAAGSVDRLHQEDAAQLLGLDTRDPDRKFQRGRALPSLREIAARLLVLGIDPRSLLALTTFNLAIGNVDAHAKNISVLHRADGTHALAPAYDVAFHTHHTGSRVPFAMDVRGQRDVDAIDAEALVAEGRSWSLSGTQAARTVSETLGRLDAALDALDPAAHAGVGADAWSTVRDRVARLRAGSPVADRPRRPPRAAAARGPPGVGLFNI